MATNTRRKLTVPSSAKVDETIDLKGTAFVVRLPDGTVVSGSASYTPRHAGEHVFVIAGGEHTVEVSAK